MKNIKTKLSNVWDKLKNPPTWGKAIGFFSTLVLSAGALCILLVDYEGSALSVVAYALFALAALSLAYSVYLLVKIVPKIKRGAVERMEKREFSRLLLRDYGFRTLIFAVWSFIVSAAFGAMNGYTGIKNRSVWYGALSAYYVALAFLRGSILLYHGKRKRRGEGEGDEIAKAKVYRNSGIVLLVLNVALSSEIAQMIFSDAHFSYMGWLIFAYAAYAFYKITMAIVNLVRASKQSDLTVRAIRNVNLADAAVSLLALQTALLSVFSDESVDVSLVNTLTGSLVSLLSVGLGVYMVVSGKKKIKKAKEEESRERSV